MRSRPFRQQRPAMNDGKTSGLSTIDSLTKKPGNRKAAGSVVRSSDSCEYREPLIEQIDQNARLMSIASPPSREPSD